MTIDEIIDYVTDLEGVLALRPGPGDGSPEISWGDTFFYYSPEGVVPTATQPFATIVTKNYPDDEGSHLDRPGAFRVNVAAGKDAFTEWTGAAPRDSSTLPDPGVPLPTNVADTRVRASGLWIRRMARGCEPRSEDRRRNPRPASRRPRARPVSP